MILLFGSCSILGSTTHFLSGLFFVFYLFVFYCIRWIPSTRGALTASLGGGWLVPVLSSAMRDVDVVRHRGRSRIWIWIFWNLDHGNGIRGRGRPDLLVY